MTSDRKKPGVAFWTTVVVVVLLVGYPLSFGPACWISSRTGFALRALPTVYRPFVMLMAGRVPTEHQRMEAAGSGSRLCSYPDGSLVERYACLGAPEGWRWRCFADFGFQHGRTERLTDDVWEWANATRPPAK